MSPPTTSEPPHQPRPRAGQPPRTPKSGWGTDRSVLHPTRSTPQERTTSTQDLRHPPPSTARGTEEYLPNSTGSNTSPRKSPRHHRTPSHRRRARARANPTAPEAGGAPPPPRPPQHLPPSCVRMPPTHDHPRVMPTRNTHPPPNRKTHLRSLPNHNIPITTSTQPPPIPSTIGNQPGAFLKTSRDIHIHHSQPSPKPSTIHSSISPCSPDAHTCSRPSTSRHRSHMFARDRGHLPCGSGLTPVRPHSSRLTPVRPNHRSHMFAHRHYHEQHLIDR